MQEHEEDFFSTPGLTGLVQQLKHLSVFGADALVVEGEQGSGKTTLLSHFAQTLSKSASEEVPIFVTAVSLPEDVSLQSFLQSLVTELGLPHEPSSPGGALLKQLRSYAQSLLRERKLALILLDDGHHISDEVLAALLSLLQGAEQQSFGMRFVFFADQGLAARLDTLDLLDIAIYDFEMPAFSAGELERFLNSKVPDLDYLIQSNKLPSVATIWNRVNGNPGKAYEIAAKASEPPPAAALASDIRKMPILHIVVLAILFSVLIMVFMYRGSSEEALHGKVPEAIEPESLVAAGPAAEDQSDAMIVAAPGNVLDVVSETEESEPSAGVIITELGEPLTTTDASSEGGSQAIDNGFVLEEVSELVFDDEPVEEEVVLKAPPRKIPKTSFDLTEQELALMELDSSGYMLQLVAASQPSGLKTYVSSQPNRDKLFIYRKRRPSDAYWFIVVLGPYDTRNSAQAAIARLSEGQRKAGPWVKSLVAIQRDIDELGRR